MRRAQPPVLTVDPRPFAPQSKRLERSPIRSGSRTRPRPAAIVLPAAARLGLLFIAGTLPVLSIPLQVFGVLPMTVTARFVVLPLAVVALAIMAGPSTQGAWAVQGFIAGLVAVTVYDAMRLPVGFAMGLPDFIPQVGGWVLNSDSPNVLVGYLWRYLGDGAGIGVAYFVTCGVAISLWPAAIRTRPVSLSVCYGILIWSGLIGTIALSASGASLLFPPTSLNLLLSLVGHLIYGGVLGLWLRHVLSGPVTGAWPTTRWSSGSRAADRAIRPYRRHHRILSPVWVSVRPVSSNTTAGATAGGSPSLKQLTAVASQASAPPYQNAARWQTSAPPYQAAAQSQTSAPPYYLPAQSHTSAPSYQSSAPPYQSSAPPYQSSEQSYHIVGPWQTSGPPHHIAGPYQTVAWDQTVAPYQIAGPDQIVAPYRDKGETAAASGRDARHQNERRFGHPTVRRPGDTEPRNPP